jgi:hypothetical protein
MKVWTRKSRICAMKRRERKAIEKMNPRFRSLQMDVSEVGHLAYCQEIFRSAVMGEKFYRRHNSKE